MRFGESTTQSGQGTLFQKVAGHPQDAAASTALPDVVLTRQSASWTCGVACWDVEQPQAHRDSQFASSSSGVSASVRQPVKRQAQTFELKYMQCPRFGYENIPRIYGGFTRSAAPWPDPQSESSSWKPFFYSRQKHFKYGGCPECPARALTSDDCHRGYRVAGHHSIVLFRSFSEDHFRVSAMSSEFSLLYGCVSFCCPWIFGSNINQ